MKIDHWIHLTSSRPFVRLSGELALDSKVQRRTPAKFRKTGLSRNPGILDEAGLTPNRLLNRALILPAFAAIVAMVIVFLGISWSIRAGQLLLPKVKNLLSAALP